LIPGIPKINDRVPDSGKAITMMVTFFFFAILNSDVIMIPLIWEFLVPKKCPSKTCQAWLES